MLIPYAKRRSLHSLWVSVLIGYCSLRQAELKAYRRDNLYLLQFSPSKIYLEHFLNDLFDNMNRGIFISNTEFINPDYRYNLIEDRVTYIFNSDEAASPLVYLYNKDQIDNQAGFIIFIPSSIVLSDVMRLKISNAIDKFNICTIHYKIQNYE